MSRPLLEVRKSAGVPLGPIQNLQANFSLICLNIFNYVQMWKIFTVSMRCEHGRMNVWVEATRDIKDKSTNLQLFSASPVSKSLSSAPSGPVFRGWWSGGRTVCNLSSFIPLKNRGVHWAESGTRGVRLSADTLPPHGLHEKVRSCLRVVSLWCWHRPRSPVWTRREKRKMKLHGVNSEAQQVVAEVANMQKKLNES